MADILKIFQGQWTLKRFVKDGDGIILSTMKGDAFFSKNQEEILYQEKVKNHYSAHIFSASKKYLYKLTSTRLNIHLLDNRLFASFNRTKLIGAFSSFLCGDDCYQTMFSTLNCEEIVQIVQVSGKTKQFSIQTQLLKISK